MTLTANFYEQPTLNDWLARRREIRKMYPDDLLEDLQESEPALYYEALLCDENIARLKRQQLESSVSQIALQPSLLTKGWDNPLHQHKTSKNWPDMENLLKLYAIGLYFRQRILTPQAEHDTKELTKAVEQIGQRKSKNMTAEKRLQQARTYLRFGLRTLDAFFVRDLQQREYALHDLDNEINYALSGNYYNGSKLEKSKALAMRIGREICERYK
ncbi:MAG: hypothetical protein E7021_05305 [Alphaproteobacteria bacterium]|nr:hypothetical protein [Alphaproteobacteria bacterium]